MTSKKDASSGTRTNDIELLFSRAGMIGAKYREFPRPDQSAVHASPETEEAKASVASPINSVSAVPAPRTPSLPGAPTHVSAWSSLEGIFDQSPLQGAPGGDARRGVKLALLSQAGGVGKTTLAATLARLLSGMNRQVLVADCGVFPSLPHHFGSRGQRLGPLQFFYAPAGVAALPIGMFRLALDGLQDPASRALLEQAAASESVLLLDLPTLQAASAPEVLAYADHVLVPVTPDVHSISGLSWLKQMLASRGAQPHVHYLLNRFDASRLLHREIRDRLRQQLGSSLLPFAIAEDACIQEASAKGMTVVDFHPGSAQVEQFAEIAAWVHSLCEVANGVRQKGPA